MRMYTPESATKARTQASYQSLPARKERKAISNAEMTQMRQTAET